MPNTLLNYDSNIISNQHKIERIFEHPIIIISGWHGVGKGTTIDLLQQCNLNLQLCQKVSGAKPEEIRIKKGRLAMHLPQFNEMIEKNEIIFYEEKHSGLKTGYLVDELFQIIEQNKIPLLEIGATNSDFSFLRRNNLVNRPNILLIFIKNSNENQTLQQIVNRNRGGQEGVLSKIRKNHIPGQENQVEKFSHIIAINEWQKQDECVEKISEEISNFLSQQFSKNIEKSDNNSHECELDF